MLKFIRNLLLVFGLVYIGCYLNMLFTGYYNILSPIINILIVAGVIIATFCIHCFSMQDGDQYSKKRANKVRNHKLYNLFIDEDSYRRRIPDPKLPNKFYTWLHLREDNIEFSPRD